MYGIRSVHLKSLLIFGLLLFIASAHADDMYERMHTAIIQNDIPEVENLIKSELDPDLTLDSRAAPTFLTQATRLGRIEIVHLLISAGADVNYADGDNNSPLNHACKTGNMKLVKILLKAGANPNHGNKWGETPMEMVRGTHRESIISLLKKAGAK